MEGLVVARVVVEGAWSVGGVRHGWASHPWHGVGGAGGTKEWLRAATPWWHGDTGTRGHGGAVFCGL